MESQPAPKENKPSIRRRGQRWARVSDDQYKEAEAVPCADPSCWHVMVAMAELVREEPLESEMRSGIVASLESVAGVSSVEEEDREVWYVEGSDDGAALVRAVGSVVDRLAVRARALW